MRMVQGREDGSIMSRVKKIFGPPGTGKTTSLLTIVEEALAAKIPPERIAYLSFTKKASDEAISRAQKRFGFPEERFPHFRTLHSLAFRNLHARRDDMMQDEHFKELGRQLGFEFTSAEDEYCFIPVGTALGDRAERITALSRLRGVSLEEQWYQSNYRDVPWLAVEQWSRALTMYKESRGMTDFTDLLEQYDESLNVEVFIVDEAQDLSPLQWRVVKKAATNAKRVYLAGDDDQAIYGWAGADVSYFLRIAGDVEILPQSFRLPAAVQRLADSVANRIRVRQPKTWHARDDEGQVRRMMYEQGLDLSSGEWLLLARNKSFLKRYQDICEAQGYTYMRNGKHSTDDSTTTAILAWENLRKGFAVKPSDSKALSNTVLALEDWLPREDVVMKDVPLPDVIKQKSWMDVLEMQPRKREYIRACLANKERLQAKPRITISTIHSAKGGEADHVAFIPDLSAQPWNALNTDDEYRVLYVGVTRARKSLTIIQPQSNRHYQI